MNYLYLLLAIVAEVVATSTLKATDGFSRPLPTLIVAAGYSVAFFLLSIVVKSMSVGIVYAIWSGAGIVLVTAVGAVWLKQVPDRPAIIGIALIMAGVIVVNLFSKSVTH
ncbi:MAG: QacE family quaternary ammonium compound efflux SMR transporter [Planctomycetota bacterium]|nr:MAG: QacE family quaternary ammonium compound efflux SMR transporter [Planctomycetota bacterium]